MSPSSKPELVSNLSIDFPQAIVGIVISAILILALSAMSAHAANIHGAVKSTGLQTGVQSGETDTTNSGATNILILLDCSFSMKDKLGDGQPKIIEAKRVLEGALDSIPPDVNIGLRIFGQIRARGFLADCQQCELLVPLGTGNRRTIISQCRWLAPSGGTPLTYALMQAEHDLRDTRGVKTIILISDGAETCCGDPCEFIARMQSLGEHITVQVVGLDLRRDHRAREQLTCISEQAGGKYYDADTSAQLVDSMSHIVRDAVSGQLMSQSNRFTMKIKPAPEVSVISAESGPGNSDDATAKNEARTTDNARARGDARAKNDDAGNDDVSSLSIERPPSPAVPDKVDLPSVLAVNLQESFYQETIPKQKLERYALEFVNQERRRQGLEPLQWDDLAYHVAEAHVDDLCHRNTVSYFSKLDEGPDLRYTKAGGNNEITESLESVTGAYGQNSNRALAVKAIWPMLKRPDDRNSLMSPYATHFAFSFGVPAAKEMAIACAEVVRQHGAIDPVQLVVKVGDQVEVKGEVSPPFQFSNVSVAWEQNTLKAPGAEAEEDSQNHPMSYFPPFDYMCYAKHDPSMLLERVVNLTPIFVWVPSLPVPVRGGIKVEGSSFVGTIAINHENKEGLYYLTVWATAGEHGPPVAISRRVIVATAPDPSQIPAKEHAKHHH